MQAPVVTVVTPSYNQGHFIRATIESVLSQDYPHVEYIVMDGGSADETKAIARDYASRLRFISEPDRGQSHAINKGFRMGKGGIVAWLNSDDLFLPGAITTAVAAFSRTPAAGLVYGEGYLIDKAGAITGRFPHTQPLNLWRLVHLSDYILQQSAYFRRDVLEEVGYLDENLHYGMDWDIFIRIGVRYSLEYIPEYMGCLREYSEAKSSAGGARRIRELHNILRKHTGVRLPPGSIVYGLDTYSGLWCDWLERRTPAGLDLVSSRLRQAVRLLAGQIMGWTSLHCQGLYSDGWAARILYYMLPPGKGPILIKGSIPVWANSLRGQKLKVECNGKILGSYPISVGDFQVHVEVPPEMEQHCLRLRIVASRAFVPAAFHLQGDHRRLAFRFDNIRRAIPVMN